MLTHQSVNLSTRGQKTRFPESTRKGLTAPPPPSPVDIALAPLQLFLPGQHLLPSPPSSASPQSPPEPWHRGRAWGGPYLPGVVPFHSGQERSLACKDAPVPPPSLCCRLQSAASILHLPPASNRSPSTSTLQNAPHLGRWQSPNSTALRAFHKVAPNYTSHLPRHPLNRTSFH